MYVKNPLMKGKNARQPVTYGFNWKNLVEGGYPSGGAGYLLSKESMNILGSNLVASLKFCPNTGIEDVDVGKCLRKLKVFPGESIDSKGRERFHTLNITDNYNWKNIYNPKVLAWLKLHASKPLQEVSYFEKGSMFIEHIIYAISTCF